MRRPWLLVSAAWIVPASLAAVNEFAQRRIYGNPPPSAGEVLFISLDWLFYAALTPAVFAISQRWPLTRPRLASRAVLHFILSIGFCAAWAAGGILLQAILVAIFRPPQFQGLQFVSWFFTTLPSASPSICAWSAWSMRSAISSTRATRTCRWRGCPSSFKAPALRRCRHS